MFSRHLLTNLYKRESDRRVKERLLLVLKAKHDGMLLLILQMNFIEAGLGLPLTDYEVAGCLSFRHMFYIKTDQKAAKPYGNSP